MTATDTATAPNKWATRIDALLRKAESTDNEHEAQTYAAKAAELIVMYGIEQAEIDQLRADSGQQRGKIIQHTMWFGGTYAMGTMLGAFYVIQALSDGAIVCMKSHNKQYDYMRVSKAEDGSYDKRRGYYLFLHGYESDIEQALLLISSISIQATRAMANWWSSKTPFERSMEKRYGTSDAMRKRSYIEGYFSGAASKIREARRETIQEAEEATSGTELVLVERRDQVRAWMAEENIRIGGKARGSAADGSAYRAGSAQGRRADVGQPRFAGSSRAIGR